MSVERAAKNAGKREHIVDLVRVIAASRGDDARVRLGVLGHDFGCRVGEREHDRVFAIFLSALTVNTPGPLTPMNRCAPRAASSIGPVSCVHWCARQPGLAGIQLGQGVSEMIPLRSHTDDLARACRLQHLRDGHARRTGADDEDFDVARAFSRTIFSALNAPPSTTTAVPCWSSWNTGISSSRFNRSSISKQRGALMSSRLMPPKPWKSISRR